MAKRKKKGAVNAQKFYEALSKPYVHHTVIACGQNNTMSMMWTKKDDPDDLIDTVWQFASYHHKMLKKAPFESKIAIVIVRNDGETLSFGQHYSEPIPKTRTQTKIALAAYDFI